MTESPGDPELHEANIQDLDQLSKKLEEMVEVMENVLVQLTWMAYDMVVLRADPEVAETLRKLMDECLQCKTVLDTTCVEAIGRSTT